MIVTLRAEMAEVAGWARQMLGARAAMVEELSDATDALSATGAGVARTRVRVDTGRLQETILPEEAAFAGDTVTGSYAPDTEYAAIHEFGGVIVPKKGRYLRFTGRNGRPVFARRVVITPQPYMRPSAEAVRARLRPAYEAAMRRVLSRLGR